MPTQDEKAFEREFKQNLRVRRDVEREANVVNRFANAYQQQIASLYDVWSTETLRLLALGGRTARQADGMITGRLEDLGFLLEEHGRARIAEAADMGLGSTLIQRPDSLAVQKIMSRLITANDEFIATSLLLDIRQAFTQRAAGSFMTIAPEAFAAKFLAALEVRSLAGEDAESVATGERPVPVRWVLDSQAEHCADDPAQATFGCPNLARVYPNGWDSMPTVPAGNVSCYGECRCQIEADLGSGWERVT